MRQRKGIVLAGGSGTRLHPVTLGVSKQLLPVHDKPMIYYPLSLLIMAGVEEIAVITTPDDQPAFRRLLGDGGQLGLAFEFIAQPAPDGLAQAYLLAEPFLAGAPSVLALGDNIFHGPDLQRLLDAARRQILGATLFAHPVSDPERYGVVETDSSGRAVGLVEKPARPQSRLAATGLYFADHEAPSRAATLRPSARGELEITALLETYLAEGRLEVATLGPGHAWFDTGTHESLCEAVNFVRTVERHQGLRIGCIEEAAYRRGLIDAEALLRLAAPMGRTAYAEHLRGLAAAGVPRPAAGLLKIA